MADTSFVGELATTLAAPFMRLSTDEDARKRATRRLKAAAGVAVLHLLFLYVLLQAEWFPSSRVIPSLEPPLLWLLIPEAAKVQKTVPVSPHKELSHEATTTIVVPVIKPQPENNAIDLGLCARSGACLRGEQLRIPHARGAREMQAPALALHL